MKKILIMLIWLFLIGGTFATNFGCSRNENEPNSIYLGSSVLNLTNSADNLKCSKRLDKMTINTLDGDDKIDTLKSDNNGTLINLGNGNDIFNQNVDHGVLNGITINGGNGYDKLVINKKKERLVIDGNCANLCKIYLKDERGSPWRKFKNITLKSIEEIQTPDGVLKFNRDNSNQLNNNLKNKQDNTNQGNKQNNISNNQSAEKLPPYSYKKFQHVLNQCKLTYPDGSRKLVDKGQFQGYKSDVFYADTQGNMIFDLKKTKDVKMRVELRQQQNHQDSGWRIDENKIHTLTATVKLQKLNKALEYTFLQIHSEVHPLLRVVVEKEKNGEHNHIWAVVRINTNDSGKRTNRYDLGAVSDNYDSFKIEVGNNKLKIYKNGKLYVDKDVSYWPEKKNYFKAGIYDSKDSPPSFEIKIKFSQLDMVEGTANKSINTGSFNSKSNNINNQGNNFNIKQTSFYFAPYVDTTLYPFPLLSDISKKTGNKNYVLAFVISKNGKCEASWGGYYSIDKGPDSRINGKQYYLYDEISKVKNNGGKLMISFGGASGIPLFAACKDINELVNQYSKVINRLKIYDLDFDVEDSILANKEAITRLILALNNLQKKYNNKLNIYFTLPVMPEGLTLDGINFVKQVVKNNLLYAGINLMTMDYGSSYNKDMGNYAIQAVNSVVNQLKAIYSNNGVGVPESKLKSILGITPMIGLNDITTENFTLEDAKQVAQYVKSNGLNRLSYWSLNRDHPCSKNSVDLKCSSKNNQAQDYQYLKTFRLGLGFGNNKNTYLSYKNNTNSTKSNNLHNKPGYKKESPKNNIINSELDLDSIINNFNLNNPWRNKIKNLTLLKRAYNKSILNKFYLLFVKFFNDKKTKILANRKYWNEDYYNYLRSFTIYTDWLFTDLDMGNYENVFSYVNLFKKVIYKLSLVK